MAYDLTPTKNRAIIVGGILAALTLFSLHYVFDSYFIAVTEGVQHDKLASPEQLLATRAGEHKALASGPVTLDNAMAQLARQGRAGVSGGVDIAPKQSDDIGSLTGWNKMPRPAERFAGSTPAAGADAGAVDAGAPASTAAAADAGSALSTGGDAGPTYNPQR